MGYFNRLSCMILISSACAFFAGCFAIVSPVPTPTRVKNVDGGSMPRHLNIGSIRPGSTRRGEILQKVGRADAGLHSKRMFLARWKVSHMAVCWAAGGEGGGGDAGCRRVWRAHNLIVEFDGKGIVRKVRRVGDHDIGKVLAAWLAADPAPPLDLSHPIQVTFFKGRYSGNLTLGRDLLAYQYKGRRLKSLHISRRQILGVRTRGWTSHDYIKVEIRYRKGPKATKKLKFWTFPSTLLTLIEYMEQTQGQGPLMSAILETNWK